MTRFDDAHTWKALSDPTRREILDVLRRGPETTGALAQRFPVTRFAVMKHLAVLHEAGLIRFERQGKERWNHLNPVPIQRIYRRWIRPFEARPADRLLRLQRHLEEEETRMSERQIEKATIGEVTLEIQLEATPERVWKGLTTEIGAWWPEAFYAGGEPGRRQFHLDLRPGGTMGETWEDGGGLLWATVLGVYPHQKLEVRGDYSPTWGGPGCWIGTWTLEAEGNGTRLKFNEAAFGRVTEQYQKDKAKGWGFLYDRALRAYLAGSEPPEWVD